MSTINFSETNFNKVFLNDYDHLGWEMTPSEKIVFVNLLKELKPNLALEIGSRAGGSLQVISRFTDKVICMDIDDTIVSRIGSKFKNVEFKIGDSKRILPSFYEELLAQDIFPQFIHLDGDHTEEGAYLDLLHTLRVCPPNRTIVLMHDTFNPLVRKGIERVPFEEMEYLHHADLDFMPGVIHERAVVKDEMWGGMSLFILEPTKRNRPIVVNNFLSRVVSHVAKISSHSEFN